MPVALGDEAASIALIERKRDDAYLVVLPSGRLARAEQVFPLYDYEVEAAILVYAALAVSEELGGAAASRLKAAVGGKRQEMLARRSAVACEIVDVSASFPVLVRRALAGLHARVLEIAGKFSDGRTAEPQPETPDGSRETASGPAIPLLAPGAAWAEDSHIMPEESRPWRGSPDAAAKDRGYLEEGVLPDCAARSFYCGSFHSETGELTEVRTYEQTGFGQLQIEDVFSPDVVRGVQVGAYAFFFVHDNANVYVPRPPDGVSIQAVAFRRLASQFSVADAPPAVFEEMPSPGGKASVYLRRDRDLLGSVIPPEAETYGLSGEGAIDAEDDSDSDGR